MLGATRICVGVRLSGTLYVLCADGVCFRALPLLAQSVERLTRNEQVDSSILSSGSSALDVKASRVSRIRSVSPRYGYLREWRNW